MSGGYGILDSDFSSDFGGALKRFFKLDSVDYAQANSFLLDALSVNGKQVDKWIGLASKGKSVLGFSSGPRQDARRKRSDDDWVILDLATRALQSGAKLTSKSWNLAREAARRETEMLGSYIDPRIRRAVLYSLDKIITDKLEGKRIRVSDVADIAVGNVKDHKKLERWFSNEPFNKKRLRRSTRKARK